MTVGELIEELKKLPHDSQVILQKDAEGNGYSPLSDVDGDAIYREDSSWSGDVFSTAWTAEEAGFSVESEWSAFKEDHARCVVLAPVN